jgi:hypothetical protein
MEKVMVQKYMKRMGKNRPIKLIKHKNIQSSSYIEDIVGRTRRVADPKRLVGLESMPVAKYVHACTSREGLHP